MLQHAARHCNTPEAELATLILEIITVTYCNMLQHAARHCNTPEAELATLILEIITMKKSSQFQGERR